MGHQLIALLRGGIEGDWIVDLVVSGVRHFLVGAIDTGGRGVDQMVDRVVPTGFEDVIKAYEIRTGIKLDISMNNRNRVENSMIIMNEIKDKKFKKYYHHFKNIIEN